MKDLKNILNIIDNSKKHGFMAIRPENGSIYQIGYTDKYMIHNLYFDNCNKLVRVTHKTSYNVKDDLLKKFVKLTKTKAYTMCWC